jgi:hypothetical protein
MKKKSVKYYKLETKEERREKAAAIGTMFLLGAILLSVIGSFVVSLIL